MKTNLFLTVSIAIALSFEAMAQESRLPSEEHGPILYTLQETKVVRDVYVALDAQWNNPLFKQLLITEKDHVDYLAKLVNLYGLNLPTAIMEDEPGVFNDESLEKMYASMVATGRTSEIEAYQIGAKLEETLILEMTKIMNKTDVIKVFLAYQRVVKTSQYHLRLLVTKLRDLGVEYNPTVLSKADYDAIFTEFNAKNSSMK